MTVMIKYCVNKVVIVFCLFRSGEKMCINTDIACLLSVGCGNYPPKEIGNCDIDNLLDMKHLHQAPERIKNAVQTLLACVSLLVRCWYNENTPRSLSLMTFLF